MPIAKAMSTSPTLPLQLKFDPLPSTATASDQSEASPAEYPQFILFGDSITQFGTSVLQPCLQSHYIRRLDVINRGLSGFTSLMGLRALQRLLPLDTQSSSWPHIKLITIFFGANDACIPGEYQHVSLQSYVEAIRDTIRYPVLQQQGSRKTQIILITPPPVNEHQFERMPSGNFLRRAGITSQYARAAAEVGKVTGVAVLDFWTILMRKVGWKESMGRECCCEHIPCRIITTQPANTTKVQHIPGCCCFASSSPVADCQLSDFLTDGLHLTELGYDVLSQELMELIQREMPECAPENLPFILPEWRDVLNVPKP